MGLSVLLHYRLQQSCPEQHHSPHNPICLLRIVHFYCVFFTHLHKTLIGSAEKLLGARARAQRPDTNPDILPMTKD